jgi:protein required for attachment to host cells
MNNWIVVANSARARVLREAESVGRDGTRRLSYETVADLVHPQSRQKGVDLADDRPGQIEGVGHGLGSSSYEPRTNPRDREHDRFALRLARFLDEGLNSGRCAGIVLVASNPFLGELKAHLSEAAGQAVIRTIGSDYTGLPERDLIERLRHHD